MQFIKTKCFKLESWYAIYPHVNEWCNWLHSKNKSWQILSSFSRELQDSVIDIHVHISLFIWIFKCLYYIILFLCAYIWIFLLVGHYNTCIIGLIYIYIYIYPMNVCQLYTCWYHKTQLEHSGFVVMIHGCWNYAWPQSHHLMKAFVDCTAGFFFH